jgi:2-amino-4-hydroxy-6-hydroxymethyldihydropteridine diphosphokinase
VADGKAVYIGLGSNLGDRDQNIADAIEHIGRLVGKIVAQSSICETAPWGFQSPNKFHNAVILVETTLSPDDVLKITSSIEEKLGRKRTKGENYADRPIDIDIIDFNGLIIKTIDFELPHPRMHLRSFVLNPLEEISPDWIHPVFNMDIGTLRKQFEAGRETIK